MDCYKCEHFLTAMHMLCGKECIRDEDMTESDLQRHIIETIKVMGGIAFRINSGSSGRHNIKLAPNGTPDILAILPGKTLWIEVKIWGGKLRESQVKMHKRLKSLGQTVIIAYSIDDVLEATK